MLKRESWLCWFVLTTQRVRPAVLQLPHLRRIGDFFGVVVVDADVDWTTAEHL